MGLAVNIQAAILLAISIAFYVGIYTIWLKRLTPQNIVIGGAAGRVSAGDRLGCRDRSYRRAAGAAVPDHILMDAAAFLEPGALRLQGLRARGHPHAAGRPRCAAYAACRFSSIRFCFRSASVLPWALGYAGVVYGAAACFTLAALGFLVTFRGRCFGTSRMPSWQQPDAGQAGQAHLPLFDGVSGGAYSWRSPADHGRLGLTPDGRRRNFPPRPSPLLAAAEMRSAAAWPQHRRHPGADGGRRCCFSRSPWLN